MRKIPRFWVIFKNPPPSPQMGQKFPKSRGKSLNMETLNFCMPNRKKGDLDRVIPVCQYFPCQILNKSIIPVQLSAVRWIILALTPWFLM